MKTPQLPVPALAAALNLTTELWLKREDLHKNGSHKGRSIPLMIKEYARGSQREFAISSSGNAALAAIIDVGHHNKNKPTDPLRLTVYIGTRIDAEKERRLREAIHDPSNILIVKTENPKQAAFQHGKNGAILLRQSTDDLALRGYTELAEELGKIPSLSAIFLPASSGTTAQGLFDGFKQITKGGFVPELHIVQTPSCHPLADAVRNILGVPFAAFPEDEQSLATSIVDAVAHRSGAVALDVTESGGNAWIIANKEVERARELVKNITGLDISPTSALSVAALAQALEAGWQPRGTVVCLITGA